eukprot:5367270-Prymnesium_polylepis.1
MPRSTASALDGRGGVRRPFSASHSPVDEEEGQREGDDLFVVQQLYAVWSMLRASGRKGATLRWTQNAI